MRRIQRKRKRAAAMATARIPVRRRAQIERETRPRLEQPAQESLEALAPLTARAFEAALAPFWAEFAKPVLSTESFETLECCTGNTAFLGH